ncbi:NAD-dependent epimerase/dehydratase family protein [Paenibacillus contaminans]|uniref:NAD-dependent dehydratase n=1 Tax=Paenibacillus contaminans TaxID=450362 RepID=A0A329LVA8_9BACL|nr:NAD-dependent epimerase/dehydratase family protein [Paenibacillus contaminans]RAV08647.1 NAD-dependent dehydratase [Paenibacillus contaminans]
MKSVLVLGGTRFFGKRLVERLIASRIDVTILTRGQTPDSFGDAVKRVQADRTDPEALEKALGGASYDVVYDNICYTPVEAEQAAELFAGRTGNYIVTSSLSVYPYGEPRKLESFLDPYAYPLPDPYPAKPDYAEGKRLVEAVLAKKAKFPFAAVRFPIVLGPDDYTRRLHFHVEHVRDGLPIGIPNPDAKMSFIHSGEAAAFLEWLGRTGLEGPVNACSLGEMSPGRIVAEIEKATGKQAVVERQTEQAHMSPFGVADAWYMDTAKAASAGFVFERLDEWMPALIRELAALDRL